MHEAEGHLQSAGSVSGGPGVSGTPAPGSLQPESLIVELRSIIDPLDFDTLFPVRQPVEIDLGCGDGGFLLQYAAVHPDRNFIGVERLLGRLRKLDRKGRRLGLQNLRGVRIECGYFLEYLVRPGTVSVLHVYFPDPWPKKKHQRHRLVNEHFVDVAARALCTGGRIYFRTDHPEYFARICELFSVHPRFRRVETPEELMAVRTDFQMEFEAKGLKTMYAAFERTG